MNNTTTTLKMEYIPKRGDTVYLWQFDPKCETIYEVQKVSRGQSRAVTLYHPKKGTLLVLPENVKPSLH